MRKALTPICLIAIFAVSLLIEPKVPISQHAVPAAFAQKIQTRPLYRFASDQNQYLLLPGENGQPATLPKGMSGNFKSQGIIGHVPGGTHQLETAGVYMAAKTDDYGERYFYTTKVDELELKTQQYGWTKVSGNIFYVSVKPVQGMVPLYVLFLERTVVPSGQFYTPKLGEDGYFYTTDEKEKNNAIAAGYKYPHVIGYIYSGPQPPTSTETKNSVPQIPPGKPAPDADTDLLKRGCTRPGLGAYQCPTVGGYEACESYRQQGKVKACTTTANLKIQAAMEKELFYLGCTRFLDRPDEFRCKTQKSLDLCETYRKNGKLTKCLKGWTD
jgi:hypothetical protein